MGKSKYLISKKKTMVARPLQKLKKVHKRTKRFVRCEFEDYPGRLKATWRKPRGLDNTTRRRLRGARKEVKIGWGSNKRTRHVLPNGLKKVLVSNEGDLEMLMMNNRTHCGEIAACVGQVLRKKLMTRAAELNVTLTNAKGKVATEEKTKAE